MSFTEINTESESYQFENETVIWKQFASADNDRQFYKAWLSIFCRPVQKLTKAALLLGVPDEGPFLPVAVWPDVNQSIRDFSKVAEKVLSERRGLILDNNQDEILTSHHIGFPIELSEKIFGLVVVDIPATDSESLQVIMRELFWGSAWLTVRLSKDQQKPAASDKLGYGQVLDLLAVPLEQETFYASALALVTELSTQLLCDRVSIGFLLKAHIKVVAVSHSAEFSSKANLINLIGHAMDEAFDQCLTVNYLVNQDNKDYVVKRAHQKLAEHCNASHVFTIPLISVGSIVGAITFEKKTTDTFSDGAISLCETVASLAAPILEEKRRNDRPALSKLFGFTGQQIRKLFGFRFVAFKLFTFSIVFLIIFFSFSTGSYRVSAKTVIEGKIQRAITAPFSGYISKAQARHGDIVKTNQLLAVLDDRDISFQRLKLLGKKEQLLRQHRATVADHDKAESLIISAQLTQIETDLEISDYQLAQTKIIAPFQGIIVSGDLSQSLDSPVDKGQVLFEITPLNAYRVILQVDEREISDVYHGQQGVLVLTGLQDKKLSFEVKKVTPVSTPTDGRNYFRVEAHLDSNSENLRPGMEGIGKIYIGSRKLIWIWTHKLLDWVRLWVWSWWP